MNAVFGPFGFKIEVYGRCFKGTAPIGCEIFVPTRIEGSVPDLLTMNPLMVAAIERDMIKTFEFLTSRQPANRP